MSMMFQTMYYSCDYKRLNVITSRLTCCHYFQRVAKQRGGSGLFQRPRLPTAAATAAAAAAAAKAQQMSVSLKTSASRAHL